MSEIKVSAVLVSPEFSLPGLQTDTFSLCPHMTFSLHASLSLPLLIRTPVLLDQGLTLMTSFTLNYRLKGLSPNIVTSWG